MIRYTVVWPSGSEDELAEIWIHAQDRRAVSRAADAVDQQLSLDPSTKGVELSEGLRALFAPPL